MNAQIPARLLLNPKAKLRDQFHEVARFKHLSLRTEQTYWEWVVRYLKFWRDRPHAHPQVQTLTRPAATFSPSDAEKGNPLGEGRGKRQAGCLCHFGNIRVQPYQIRERGRGRAVFVTLRRAKERGGRETLNIQLG
jgi:hypothetical protein